MNEARVSILMSCYNGEHFIKRSFESILNQTWPNIELVFVDDGSTDNSYNEALSFKPRFEEKGFILKAFHQENQGCCAGARNASKIATGKYLQLLDVDDMIMSNSCRLQAEFLEKNPQCNVVRTNGYVVPEGNLELQSTPIERHPELIKSNIFIELITGETNNWAGAYMVRADLHRRFYKAHTFPLSRYGQNLQFLLPQVVDAPTGFIDKPLFRYVRYIGSHSNQPTYEKQIENLKGYWDIRRQMLSLLNITDNEIHRICEIAFNRNAFNLASRYNIEDDLNESYLKLKKLRGLNLRLKAQYSSHKNSISQYYFRALLFFKNRLLK